MKRILVVGSGRRVRDTALPAVWSLAGTWELAGVVSRKPKDIAADDPLGGRREVRVDALDGLAPSRVGEVDLVYLVVSKGAVPGVLRRLAPLAGPTTEILIETPVLLPKHLGHLGLLRDFRAAHVAEDCVFLPFLPAIDRCVASGALGGPARGAVLSHAAYAYHGVALLKRLFGAPVVRARRRRLAADLAVRDYRFAGGARAEVLEPRDYGAARIALAGPRAVLADHPLAAREVLPLRAEMDGTTCTGFRAGDEVERLTDAERRLAGAPRRGDGISIHMDGMKRIGLARMLTAIAAGRAGYAVREGVDDALVDYHLEKTGFYRANPLTSARGILSPLLFRALTMAAGRR